MDFEIDRKTTQQTSLLFIAMLILFASASAAFYPLFLEPPGEVHLEYLILGAIAAFIIFLLGMKTFQDKCPSCNKLIPADSNLCPYCGYKIKN